MATLLILSILPAFTAAANTSGSPDLNVGRFEEYLKYVPGTSGLQCALKDFLDVVKPDQYNGNLSGIALSNTGIDSYISSLLKKPDFKKTAYTFYQDVDMVIQRNNLPNHLPQVVPEHGDQSDLNDAGEAPTLDQFAGDKDNPNLKPGWLWDLALKDANGNPNEAMELIGVCGNDDKAVAISDIPVQCPSGFPDKNGDRLLDFSNFYLPRSLGAGVDISNNLKQRIIRDQTPSDQNPNPPGSNLPAKYYHVYGSAFVACEMIARGHSPSVVMALSLLAAEYYRALTLTDLAQKLPNAELPSSTSSANQDEAQGWVDSLKEISEFFRKKPKCKDPVEQTAVSKSEVSEAEKKQAWIDALELMRLRTLSGHFGKILGNLYTNIPVSIIPGMDPIAEVALYMRPAGWSEHRFKNAQTEFNHLMSDFDWTIEQHEIGAKFAVKNCKPDPAAEEVSACQR